MEFLTKDDIVLINKGTIERHGGQFIAPFNLLNESSLDYLVEAVNAQVFGTSMYPEVSDKAAFYMHSIIANHVFQDGNKRTGLASALVFLNMHGFELRDSLTALEIPEWNDASSEPILFEVTMHVAKGHVTLDILKAWLAENLIPLTENGNA